MVVRRESPGARGKGVRREISAITRSLAKRPLEAKDRSVGFESARDDAAGDHPN